MTDTKKIETDIAYRNRAYDVNALSLKHIAKTCAFNKIKLIHISTDYVFSQFSTADPLPYNCTFSSVDAFTEFSHEFPVNIYGMQKLIGEKFIKEGMKKEQYAILRTSWLYGTHNCKSFVHKFLKNFMAKKKEHDASSDSVFEFEMT
jgi:dTDP-4-dehydrorhamnose reductase